jgi:PPOX class probable FMN-dependent enzyme
MVDLAAVYPDPGELALKKQIDRLDDHCRRFVALSPFVLLATSATDGRCDVSPRGGPPGFVHVLDDRRLAIPDVSGNRRIDSIRNIAENGQVGLLFLVPGMGETLRVNGPAELSDDPELRARLAIDGKDALLAIVATADEVFLHCARALRRSDLWEPETWPARDELPSAAQIFRDHASADLEVKEVQTILDEGYARPNLY